MYYDVDVGDFIAFKVVKALPNNRLVAIIHTETSTNNVDTNILS